MSTELLVTVHDQDLLLECEQRQQFAGFPRTYLFVGPRPVDRIPNDVKMIVARDHAPNFEHWPQFYDFTGWWAAAHHGLIEADRIVCVQYDMLIADQFIIERVDKLLDEPDVGVVAFTAGHRLADNWMLLIPGFERTYRAGVGILGVDMDGWPFFNEWPSTQGTAWRTADFVSVMEWLTPLFHAWHGDVWAGHLMERVVKAWCATFNRPEAYLPGVITHLARDCHGTCRRMGGDIAGYEARAATFGKIIPG